MTSSSNKSGGFSLGLVYGLIASVVLYIVLSFLFPIDTGKLAANAPENAQNAAADAGQATQAETPVAISDAPESLATATGTTTGTGSATPEALDSPVAAMVQPEMGDSAGISLGGAGDVSPATLVNPEMVDTTVEDEPLVETRSAEVPNIGDTTRETEVPGQSENQPVTGSSAENGSGSAPRPELAQSVSGPATEVFAVAFSGDMSSPMLAIILEDTLETSLQPLVDTGRPLNFALSADVDSSESARSIRESGFEVVAMLPRGLSRSQGVEENMRRFMNNVPVAVAILDARSGGLMLNRDAMDKVLEATRPAGLGLITFAGTGDLVARDQALRAGAPYGNVVQIIDETPDVDLILQALDRAAFDALTKGSAIVFARTSPTTIEAIVRWMDGAFAQRLQVVPVSVAIRRSTN
ncbi:MAG: divergent polysaccharide deacetylase family protein [Rhodobacteraceae bacterium]|nr:divergent polysaccharide deacetylase family protein [Paracoccaceae bacterium]